MTWHGFTIKAGTSVHALTRPAVHGRPSGPTVYLGDVYRVGRKWRNSETEETFRTQEAAAKYLYRYCEAEIEAQKRGES